MHAYETVEPIRRFFGIDSDTSLQELPSAGLKLVPSDVFLWAAGGSIVVSLGLRLFGRRDASLFIGEWAPTLVSLGVLSRLVGR